MSILILVIYALLPASFAGLYFLGYIYSLGEIIEPYNLSILAGAAAYIVFMSQFLLSARLRFLERHVPQDRLLAIHGSAGMASFALILIHFVIKFIMVIRLEGISFQSALGSFVLLTSIVLSPMAYMVLRGRGLKAGHSPPYARVKAGHNLFALAGLGVVVHVMLASSTWSISLKIFTLIWGLCTLGAYVRHKILRPRRRASLKLTEVSELAPDIHRYSFEGSVSRRSGQFGYFSFESDIPGAEEHPFTVSSPVGEPVNITVRSSGDFTDVMSDAPSGTQVRFDGPYGHFGPERFPKGTPLVFLVAGIGITPVLSLARDRSIRNSYPIKIIWSIRSSDDASAASSLQALADAGELEFRTRLSGKEGRIDDATLKSEVPEITGDPSLAAWFLCGPGGFGKSMRRLLRVRGIPRRNIIEERFSW